MIKSPSSRALVVKINLIFLAFILITYAVLLLWPSLSDYHQHAASIITCSWRECHQKTENSIKMKAVLEEPHANQSKPLRETMIKRKTPNFLNDIIGRGKRLKIGIVNMDDEDTTEWKAYGQTMPILFRESFRLL
ncbi:UDP-glucuronate:xylan alpha-glucuronosyltransferase 2 [Abeliophyllum distichum]|uniref:UDP-glucuronate:xylan alpha-glucuronosyltransferase 2 n=1 Tax=Abeliophyllum distichum TaxID=126358 RepID=A0ABD1TIU3_9LAMI